MQFDREGGKVTWPDRHRLASRKGKATSVNLSRNPRGERQTIRIGYRTGLARSAIGALIDHEIARAFMYAHRQTPIICCLSVECILKSILKVDYGAPLSWLVRAELV